MIQCNIMSLTRFAWLAAVAAAMATLAWTGRGWPRYRRLAERGAAVEGWATAKDLIGRRDVEYSFRVGGRLYSAVADAGLDGASFDRLEPGDSLVVFYLPDEPVVSCLGDPGERLQGQNRLLILPLIFCGGALALALRRELKRFC